MTEVKRPAPPHGECRETSVDLGAWVDVFDDAELVERRGNPKLTGRELLVERKVGGDRRHGELVERVNEIERRSMSVKAISAVSLDIRQRDVRQPHSTEGPWCGEMRLWGIAASEVHLSRIDDESEEVPLLVDEESMSS